MFSTLGVTARGLSNVDAGARLARAGPNADGIVKPVSPARAILRRLLEPLALILLVAGLVSAATGDVVGGSIIVAILAISIGLDTVQEGRAEHAAALLRQAVAPKAEALRNGSYATILAEQIVPGDIIRVRAGDIIPADALIIESNAFTSGQAALTGEPYPVEKRAGIVTALTPGEATNAIFRGAVAQTGEAIALVVHTGGATLFGGAASALTQAQAPSPFQRDLHAFGVLTARMTIALVLVVLTAHMLFGRPVLQSLMFAVALAVGLTPELLPMITTVTLSRGAMRMAKKRVIVKRLASIHDLGAMTVLCTDKTGTLTSAEIKLAKSLNFSGADDDRPAQLGAASARLGGDRGSLDNALVAGVADGAAAWTLRARLAFDFNRRVGAVAAEGPEGALLIVKGAPEAVLALCTQCRDGGVVRALSDDDRQQLRARVQALANDGLRTVTIASKPWRAGIDEITPADEAQLIFEGDCVFADPPKATCAATIARLAGLGIRLKVLSGDDPLVVKRLAGLVGLSAETVLSGADLTAMSNDALAVQAQSIDGYGRLTPDQKARLIHALQAKGEVVGYLGDGINDAPALKAADIGLSVDGATGVAQAAADMILLATDLNVVADGVEEGRRTFANILKYVRMGASSNFGNMLSMAAASLFLPFLPMLPTQILLNNLLYDVSEIGIPFDSVSSAATARPQVWDMRALIRFAAVMGPLSSLFDLLTFAGLVLIVHAAPAEFRTIWFLESMMTQILVIFIIRTNGAAWAAKPSPALTASALGALAVAIVFPFTPIGAWFGFVTPDWKTTAGVLGLVVSYLICAEFLKAFAVERFNAPASVRSAIFQAR